MGGKSTTELALPAGTKAIGHTTVDMFYVDQDALTKNETQCAARLHIFMVAQLTHGGKAGATTHWLQRLRQGRHGAAAQVLLLPRQSA